MSFMQDIIRLPIDLGLAIKRARVAQGRKATDIAQHSGRSRDILHRLEHGQDVTVSSLMDILAAMGMVLRIERAGLPTLEEMTARFTDLEEQDDAA
jgi:HTH-type transcriptional regulator/antitoxin HipB